MKNVVTIGWSQITWIATNAQGAIIGLKGLWTRIVKEVAYNYLDLRSMNFRSHTMKQWEVIHVELDGLFYYDPPLKERTVENYMKEHLSLAKNAWKKAWVANGEVGCPNKCLDMSKSHLFGIGTLQMHTKGIISNPRDSWPCVTSLYRWCAYLVPCSSN
jgi:hypothetical protein